MRWRFALCVCLVVGIDVTGSAAFTQFAVAPLMAALKSAGAGLLGLLPIFTVCAAFCIAAVVFTVSALNMTDERVGGVGLSRRR